MGQQHDTDGADPLAIPERDAPRTLRYLAQLRGAADQKTVKRADPDRYFALVDRGVRIAEEMMAFEQLGDLLISRAWCHHVLYGNRSAARSDLARVEELADALPDDTAERFRMRCDARHGEMYCDEEAPLDARRHLMQGLERAKRLADTWWQSIFHNELGRVHGELLGDLQAELEHSVTALRLTPGDSTMLYNLARLSAYCEDWESARAYLEESLSTGTLSKRQWSQRFVMKAKLAWHEGNLDGALSWSDKAVEAAEGTSPRVMRQALNERALIHIERGNTLSAIEDLEASLTLDLSKDEACLTWATLAKCYAMMGRSDEGAAERSRTYLRTAEELLPTALYFRHDCLREIAWTRKHLGDFEGALRSIEERDEQQKKDNVSRVRSEIGSLRLLMKLEREEHERELQRLRADNLQQQLAAQASAMAAQAELIDRFRQQMTSVFHEMGEPVEALRRIQATLKTLPTQELDWTKLEAEFYAAHPDFRTKLLERHPELTAQQIRICLLLRLNLKSHEIARLTSLSDRNIEKHRLNIRKVMGLKNGDDLREALRRIDEG